MDKILDNILLLIEQTNNNKIKKYANMIAGAGLGASAAYGARESTGALTPASMVLGAMIGAKLSEPKIIRKRNKKIAVKKLTAKKI